MSKLGTFLVKGRSSFHKEFWNPFACIPLWAGKNEWNCVIPTPHPALADPSGCWEPKADSGSSFQGKVHRIRSVLHVLTHSSESFPLPWRQSSWEFLLKSTKLTEWEKSHFWLWHHQGGFVILRKFWAFLLPQPPSIHPKPQIFGDPKLSWLCTHICNSCLCEWVTAAQTLGNIAGIFWEPFETLHALGRWFFIVFCPPGTTFPTIKLWGRVQSCISSFVGMGALAWRVPGWD